MGDIKVRGLIDATGAVTDTALTWYPFFTAIGASALDLGALQRDLYLEDLYISTATGATATLCFGAAGAPAAANIIWRGSTAAARVERVKFYTHHYQDPKVKIPGSLFTSTNLLRATFGGANQNSLFLYATLR